MKESLLVVFLIRNTQFTITNFNLPRVDLIMCRKIGFCVSAFDRKEESELLEQALRLNEYDIIYAIVMTHYVTRSAIDAIISDIYDVYLKNINCYKKGFQLAVGTTDATYGIDAVTEYETKPIVTLSGLEYQIHSNDSITIIRRAPDALSVVWVAYEREVLNCILNTNYKVRYYEL